MELIRNGMSGLEVREILNTAIETIDKGIELENGASVANRYVDAITADGHKLVITRKPLPSETHITVQATVGTEESDTFISDIYATGHTLTLTKSPLPQSGGGSGMEHKTFQSASDLFAYLDALRADAYICTWIIAPRTGITTSGIMLITKTETTYRQLLYCQGGPVSEGGFGSSLGQGDYSLWARTSNSKLGWNAWEDVLWQKLISWGLQL
jgi:hypothetical protein